MRVLVKHIVLIFMIFFAFNSLNYGQDGHFQLRGRMYNTSNQSLSDVRFDVYESGQFFDNYKTSQQGNFSLRLALNKSFIVEISKAGYATKRVAIDTKVPENKILEYFDEFTLIILYTESEADLQTKSGLPSIKYTYSVKSNRFIAQDLGKNNANYVGINDQDKCSKVKTELDNLKKLFNQQKLMLKDAERIISEANVIKSEANRFADSLIRNANSRSISILQSAKKDSVIVASSLEKTTKEISHDDYKKLSVDEKEFLNRKNIKQLRERITRLSKQQKLTGQDSLAIKKDRLSIRKELFDMARYQLEIDRLNARTKEDSLRIEERESQLYLMRQEMITADQELEIANSKLILKDLELKNKNIVLLSFIVGFALLLILSGYIYYNYRDKKRINKILEYQNQELEKLSIVASETSNAVIITDEVGNFTWVNKGYTRLFGYEAEEVTGINQKCIIGPSNGDEINRLIGIARRSGEPVHYEFEAVNKNGSKIWIQTTLTPIKNKLGEVTKLIVIDSDISQIKEAEFEILMQSKKLSVQNAQIMASINYAKRIQDAMLPSEELIKTYFPDSFIYFRPRDIVSGDFYWFSVQENMLFIAIVDCTGHGVPGAFMSLIGNTLLNHIVNERKIYNPSQILSELNNGVNLALSQKRKDDDEHEDGMDLTLCCFDKSKNELQIACANHTAIIITDGIIHEFHGDEISIGESYSKIDNLQFSSQIFPFQDNSIMYLFSDGYQDQIGGPKNKKFMAGNFISFLQKYQTETMDLQFDILNEKFQKWKGANKQTDDILVMGIRLNAKSKAILS